MAKDFSDPSGPIAIIALPSGLRRRNRLLAIRLVPYSQFRADLSMKVASHDCILAPFQRNQIKATSTAPMSSIADHCAARLVIVPYSPFRARSLVCGWPTTAGPHAGPHKAGRHSPQPIERSHSQKFSAALGVRCPSLAGLRRQYFDRSIGRDFDASDAKPARDDGAGGARHVRLSKGGGGAH
jgi:hypothetical protein